MPLVTETMADHLAEALNNLSIVALRADGLLEPAEVADAWVKLLADLHPHTPEEEVGIAAADLADIRGWLAELAQELEKRLALEGR